VARPRARSRATPARKTSTSAISTVPTKKALICASNGASAMLTK
jgi:hypothetical protein